MKVSRFLTLTLAILMILPMIVSCGHTPPEVPPDTELPVAENPLTEAPATDAPTPEKTVLKIYVSETGDDYNADGSEEFPYGTVQQAVYASRKYKRADYAGIDIVIKAGTYTITSPIQLEKMDGGTESCPVRFIGEEGTVIVGGIALTAADFQPASGKAARYMPDPDKIVQIDLTKYGYSLDEIRTRLNDRNYKRVAPTFIVNGEYQTLARYPNEDWINIGARSTMIDQYGNPTMVTDNEGGEYEAVTMEIEYGKEHMTRTLSWHSLEYARAAGHYNVLWVPDNTIIMSFAADDDIMTVPYQGGYAPIEGGLLYWYNIPEELDAPGEYYIDDDGILYYYPDEGFGDAVISMPLSAGLVNMNDTDHFTLERIHFTSSLANGISGGGCDYLTIKDCEVSSIVGDKAITVNGDNIKIMGNHLHDCSVGVISLSTGDRATLREGNSIIYNNHIHDWGIFHYPYADAISGGGCGLTISHNEIHSSNASATSCGGAKVIIEYNHVYDLLRTSDDIGAVDNSGSGENITRYNYIHDVGAVGAAAAVPALNSMGSAAIYWDAGGSYATAYGNIIETVNGNGVIINGGRGCTVRNNLIIDCDRWYVQTTGILYAQMWKDGVFYPGNPRNNPDYVHTDLWKEFNPDLDKVIGDYSKTTPDDPYGWAAPAGNSVHTNWIHFNKAVRDFSNWGARPYWIEDWVLHFSGEENFDFGIDGVPKGNMSTYNSRRDKYTIEELIVQAEGVVDMDLERFAKIGRVMDEWNLD